MLRSQNCKARSKNSTCILSECAKMAALLPSATFVQLSSKGKSGSVTLTDFSMGDYRRIRFGQNPSIVKAISAHSSSKLEKKKVWIWTEKKEVMTSAVERGWNTCIFHSNRRELAAEWSSIGLLFPLFIEEGGIFDGEQKKVANFCEISGADQLERLQLLSGEVGNVVVNLLDWQVIPAETIVAAVQGTQQTVLAISKTSSEAQMFLEALELGLGGVVLKTEDVAAIFQLKAYLDKRNEDGLLLELTRATVTDIQMVGMGDRVCVDLCSVMRPGEGLLVGSFARGLFLVHSECLESNYISSRPFRVNAGPVHSYVAVPGGKTSYLSELKTGKEVLIVNQNGMGRTATIGRVKIETRPLLLLDAKIDEDNQTCSILLQNAETVALVSSPGGHDCLIDVAVGHQHTTIPVTSIKVGDQVLVRLQGGARHTGIEIQEFIIEK